MAESWENKHYSFFQNRECEYFPCHSGVPEEDFNCLFCYCPLYLSGRRCNGGYRYTKSGVKDCTLCSYPHRRENYGKMIERFRGLIAEMKEAEMKDKENNNG